MTIPPDAPAEARRPGPTVLIATLCWATFLVTGAGPALAPFLRDMARDLDSDLAAVGNLVAILSVAWGAMSLLAGTTSDRIGRRPVLVAGLLMLGGARLGLALAASYPAAVVWQLLAGMGGGSFMGTVFAAAADRVAPERRGRALGWVVAGQSFSLVFGVPLVTLIGAWGGWRGSVASQGAATLVTALAVWLMVKPAPTGHAVPPIPVASVLKLVTPRLLALLGAGTMERVCFAAVGVYLATFLRESYGISLPRLAVALALIALGNLLGNLLGGQIADRLPARPLSFAGSSLGSGLLGLPLLLWHPGLATSIVLGFAYSLMNALGRPVLLAALSGVSSEARGAILGLIITTGSVGWIVATAGGGWLIARSGFGSLGAFVAGAACCGAGLAALSWWGGRRRRR